MISGNLFFVIIIIIGRICTSNDEYQDVFPSVLPFFHIYGLVVNMLSKLEQGGKLVTLPKFKPDTYLKAIVEHKATVLYAVPPISKLFT